MPNKDRANDDGFSDRGAQRNCFNLRVGGITGRSFETSTRVRAHASWGLTSAELFPSPALSCGYP